MTDEDTGDDWLSGEQAAEIVGVSRSTIFRTPRPELPYREVGAGLGRGRNREYLRRHVLAYKAIREGTGPSFTELVADVAQLRERVADLENERRPPAGES